MRGRPSLDYAELQDEFARELADIADAAERAQRPLGERAYTRSPATCQAASAAHERFDALGEDD